MHCRFGRSPLPGAAWSDGEIIEGIEVELFKTAVSRFVLPVGDLAMPKMKNPSRDIAHLSPHIGKIGLRPGTVMLDALGVHYQGAGGIFELAQRCADDCPIAAAENRRIV